MCFNMCENKKTCPICLGVKQVMKPRQNSKGFFYRDCNFCDENGEVDEKLYQDYLLSLNEDIINKAEENDFL